MQSCVMINKARRLTKIQSMEELKAYIEKLRAKNE